MEVEHALEVNEQYGAYNHTLMDRALFLSKLEEATQVCAFVDVDGKSTTKHEDIDVAMAFDRRIDEIITQWRDFLFGGKWGIWFFMKDDEETVNVMVD